MKKPRPQQPKVRSDVARAAFEHKGAGKHGGSAKAKNRKDRRNTKTSLRKDIP